MPLSSWHRGTPSAYSHQRYAALASLPWNLITCSCAFCLRLFDMAGQEGIADEAVFSLSLTEIRCPCFIKETLTDPMGMGSRSADKEECPRSLWGKEKALFSPDLEAFWGFQMSQRRVRGARDAGHQGRSLSCSSEQIRRGGMRRKATAPSSLSHCSIQVLITFSRA